MKRLAALTASLICLWTLAAPRALAKTVSLEWKPIEGAQQYELQIRANGKSVLQKTFDDTKWKGDLPFGMYTYQLRAIDQASRPGQWTEARNLVVTPPPPEPEAVPGKNVSLYSPQASTRLKWTPVEGVRKYSVEILKDGKPYRTETVEGSQVEVPGLAVGNYSWRITGVVPGGDRKGKSSETQDFQVEHKALAAPVVVFPVGGTPPPSDGKLKLKWKPVEGAEAYELSLVRAPVDVPGREPAAAAAAFAKARTFVTQEPSFALRAPAEGRYLWKVRALANLDSKNVPHATGPDAVTRFDLDRNAVFKDDGGFIALSTMVAPYSYRVAFGPAGVQPTTGQTSSNAVTARLSGEYWFKPQWGAGLGYEHTMFGISSQLFQRKTFEAAAKYRMKISVDRYGWFLSPKLGFEMRDYVAIFPGSDSGTGTVYGATVGLDIRKQFSESLSVGFRSSYFVPGFMVSGNGITRISPEASYRNVSAGLQALYWVSQNWGLGAGGYFELRSISLTGINLPGGGSGSTQGNISLYMDGAYFYTSLVYRFWK